MQNIDYIHKNLNPETVVIVTKGNIVIAKIAYFRFSSRKSSEKSMGKLLLYQNL